MNQPPRPQPQFPPPQPLAVDPNESARATIARGLEVTEPMLWIANRQRALKNEAAIMRGSIDTAKSLSLGGLVASGGVGLLFGASGVGLVGVGLSGLAYVVSVAFDQMDTGNFAPLPFVRTNLMGRLSTLGNADERELRQDWEDAQRAAGNPILDSQNEEYSTLPPELAFEALMLARHAALIAQLLTGVEQCDRDLAYLQLCTAYAQFGDGLTGITAQRLNDMIRGQVGGNYQRMAPAQIGDYAMPIYQVDDSPQTQALPFGSIGSASRPQVIAPATPPTIAAAAPGHPLPSVELPASPNNQQRPVRRTAPDKAVEQPRPSGPSLLDLRAEIAARELLDSLIWLGPSQSGKTTTADQVGRGVKQKYGDNITIYYLSPFTRRDGANDESRLFEYADHVMRGDLLNEDDPTVITNTYTDFCNFIDNWLAEPHDRNHPKLFICDEISIHADFAQDRKIGSTLVRRGNAVAGRFFGKYTTAINMNASGGKAAGVAVWGFAPTGYVGGLGLNRSTLGAISSVYISSTDNWVEAVYTGCSKNSMACKTPPTQDQLNLWQRQGVKRVVSVNSRYWEALAEYTIPRGDRSTSEATTKKPPAPSPQKAQNYQPEITQPAIDLLSPPAEAPQTDTQAQLHPAIATVDSSLTPLARKLYKWMTEGKGKEYQRTITYDNTTAVIVEREQLIAKGHTHWDSDQQKAVRHSEWDIATACMELAVAGQISRLSEGSVILREAHL